jgi:uncharacterized protein
VERVKTRIELEAAVFRRLVDHLHSRLDVQNIELMGSRRFLPAAFARL